MFSCEFYELFKNIYFKEHLRTTGTKTPVWGFLFNKVASLSAWRLLPVLERDSSTGHCTRIFLWILRNFYESFFVEHVLATTSHMMVVFSSFLQIDEQALVRIAA